MHIPAILICLSANGLSSSSFLFVSQFLQDMNQQFAWEQFFWLEFQNLELHQILENVETSNIEYI